MNRKTHFFLTTIWLLIIWLLVQPAYAQPLDLRFSHLTVNEGLSHSDAMAVIQDKQGYIWIGTNKGMDRYDGTHIKNYSFDVEQTSSISGNRIRTLHINEEGTLYAGGENCGLNQYDLYNDHFSPINETSFPEAYSSMAQILAKATVTSIATDHNGKLWIGTTSHGLFVIEKGSQYRYESIKRFLTDSVKSKIYINDVKVDKTGRVWIGTRNAGLYRTKLSNSKIDRNEDLEEVPLPSDQVQLLYFDTNGNLWAGVNNQILFAPSHYLEKPTPIDFQKIYHGHTFRDLSDLLLDSFGRLWIGTSFGLYILHNGSPTSRVPFDGATLTLFEPQDDNPFAISSSRIHKLYEDRFKTVWIAASSGGINKVDLLAKKFGHIRRRPSGHASIPNNYINTLHIDQEEELLWIGTRNGFSAYNLNDQKVRNYLHKEKGGDVTGIDVSSIMKDRQGTIWVGTWNNGFFLLHRDGINEKIEHHVLSYDTTSRTNQSVTYLTQDKFNNIWMATASMGLRKYSPSGKLLQTYDPGNSAMPTSNMSALFYDSTTSILWAATQNAGLLKLRIEPDTLHVMKQFRYDPHDTLSLGIDYVWPIFKDSKGDLWIGTIGAGLHKLVRDCTGEEIIIRYRQWLPESDVESILEDDQGNLWIGGAGLFKFNPDTKSYLKYDVEDGLQSNSFKVGAACEAKDGTMYFGGINGISFFDPNTIQINPHPPVVLITALRIHNKMVQIGEKINGRILLPQNLSLTEEVVIKDIENDFSFDFVSLHYTNPAKHLYAYKLDGYHDDWVYLEKGQQSANFSNLDAGSYTFLVKATNGEGQWSSNIAQVRIEVLPPWWKTWWAYVLYVCFILLVLWILRRITVRQQELKNELVIEQIKHEKEKELTELKLNFFTKISHELRTPLTLILGPIEDLVAASPKTNKIWEQLTLVHKQTLKLLTLVNELMDFRKIESKKLSLNVCHQDIIGFIHELFMVFQIKAQEKNIAYRFVTDVACLNMYYDPHKIEMVVTNLLSNAFKYTPEGRKVEVSISATGNPQDEAEFAQKVLTNNYLTIKVKDWGVGMSAEEMSKIFDFYYRAAKMESSKVIGTGVGLSLAKEIIERHAGTIAVSSRPNEGTEFIIRLPFGSNHFPKEDMLSSHASTPTPYINEKIPVPAWEKITNKKSFYDDVKILIVEDNEDVLQYLHEMFSSEMQVYTAHNGEEGWKAVLSIQPDLVLSDIMMRPMNGLELCKKIKEDIRTMHIPVCLLTARSAAAQELEGLELGADDYIIKPFIPKVLQARIWTTIRNIHKKREYYQKQILLQPTEIAIPDEDRNLLELSMKIVEENLENSNFNVQLLAKTIGMSQSAYYRKMKSITGQSVVEFIRDVRLKRAAQLLRESKMRVSEVSFMVGIEDMKYFRKIFRNVYKMSPSEYSKRHSMQDLSV